MKINVKEIQPAWHSCRYELQVWVEDAFTNNEYILQTLRKWFGDAEYMWGSCFLCSLKK